MGFDATGAQWELVSTTHQRSARTTRFLDDIIRHIYLNTKGSLPLHRMLRDVDLPGPLKSDFIQAADEEWHNFVIPWDTVFPKSAFPYIFGIKKNKRTRFWTIHNSEQLSEIGSVMRDIASGREVDKRLGCEIGDKYRIGLREIGFAGNGYHFDSDGYRVSLNNKLGDKGIHRLQHSCLLFRSSQACIVIDPQFSFASSEGEDWPTVAEIGEIDAVFISHSHTDHFCRASLLMLDRKTRIFVPEVNTNSMLCPDMAAFLRDAGFINVKTAGEDEIINVQDIKVETHPFYGEQPWINIEQYSNDLRNKGLTYVVECNDSRSWLLVDSGQEFNNSMAHYVESNRSKLGQIDFVFSNMRQFAWVPHSIDGTGRYLFCFPQEIVINPAKWPINEIMTLGCQGLAQVLNHLEDVTFYPYSHWWQKPLTKIYLDGEKKYEDKMVYELSRITRSNIIFKNWNIGDYIAQ